MVHSPSSPALSLLSYSASSSGFLAADGNKYELNNATFCPGVWVGN